LADSKDDARRAFKQGMELIGKGEHIGGAERLERAYALLPHPNVLYNIGLAYADGGDIEKSISYFGRYLDSGPADGAAVERLVILLGAQLRETTGPARGLPELAEPGDEPAVGDGAAPVVAGPAITALLERLERLAQRLEDGGTTLEPEPAASDEIPGAEALEAKSGDIYDTVVVSASRIATTQSDAPAAITIVTADQIRLSGATNIPDLLRSVPGMSNLTMTAGNANLAVRGFNQRISNKLLVLIDGRSVYLDFLGATLFRAFAYDLQDIERIEIVRGPGATLYGAGAFGGVVNIITKPIARSKAEGSVHLAGGTGETLMGNVRFSGSKGIFGWRGSMGYEQTDRYSLEIANRSDFEFTGADDSLAVRAVRANGAIEVRPSDDVSIMLSGGGTYVYDNFFALGLFRDFIQEGGGSHVRADLKFGGLGIRAFWNYFATDSGPSWQLVGGQDTSSSPRSHIIDVEASYSATAVLGVRHDLTVGAGYRLKTISWSYLNDDHVEQHLNGFVEDRITFIPQIVTVIGFRFDQHPLVGFTPSPRVALLIKPTAKQSFRVSAGTAFRNPSFLESYLDLTILGSPFTSVGIESVGNPDLAPEQIFSVEGGYVFEDSDFFSFEVVGYYERISNLIYLGSVKPLERSRGLELDRQIAGTSSFENVDGVFHGLGAEVGAHAFPVDGLDVRANYSFSYVIDQAKADAGLEDVRDARHPMHMVNVGASYRAPFGLDANVDFHLVSAIDLPERSFDAGGNVQIQSCEAPLYGMLNVRIGFRLLKDKLEFGVTGSNLTAFATGGHREHCFGSRIGARVLASATYRF
jgi:iron complex outermembrane receptor protein